MPRYILGLGLSLVFQAASLCAADVTIRLTPEDCKKNVESLNQELGEPADFAKDAYCAKLLLDKYAPEGVVTIFGSARLKEGHPSYEVVRKFAKVWTEKHRNLPILTAGGPGLMEAGNRGAKEAGGTSLGFTLGFGKGGIEKPNAYATDAYQFRDFAMRESWLVNPARAAVIGSGGVGTAWEIFETISKKQTKKIGDIPIVFLGTEDEWQALTKALTIMAQAGTINASDLAMIHRSTTVEDAVHYIETYPTLQVPAGGKTNNEVHKQ